MFLSKNAFKDTNFFWHNHVNPNLTSRQDRAELLSQFLLLEVVTSCGHFLEVGLGVSSTELFISFSSNSHVDMGTLPKFSPSAFP